MSLYGLETTKVSPIAKNTATSQKIMRKLIHACIPTLWAKFEAYTPKSQVHNKHDYNYKERKTPTFTRCCNVFLDKTPFRPTSNITVDAIALKEYQKAPFAANWTVSRDKRPTKPNNVTIYDNGISKTVSIDRVTVPQLLEQDHLQMKVHQQRQRTN